jgi:PIN domain nuclease of toxin-antitoxin system
MRMLLDTHAFLWFLLDDPKLSTTARNAIVDPDNDIAIKIGLNKYTLPEPYEEFIEREIVTNQFDILPVVPRHTAVLTTLPFYHRDPFDRLIIAQAIVEQMPVISGDAAFAAYPVTCVW